MYLTGMRVGGQRILILVDASSSMLDEQLVNILRVRVTHWVYWPHSTHWKSGGIAKPACSN